MTSAVIYLRVSTKDQAQKGGEAEGFSIPAQREACTKSAHALGAVVTNEFIDAGESARSADRPELQRMLDHIAAHPVDFVLVHKVDRLARNRADDVAINLAIQQSGARLVSATENIDETASGMLLHGIMSSIAEFYSRNLATEVLKGMEQKARTGGTPGMAPLGYRNIAAINSDGREVRTVEIDPDRGPNITWAYQQYATGDWTLRQLADALEARGFTTRGTRNRPGKPITITSLNALLRNPYYKGDVVYRDVAYPGRHEPLIDTAIWERVQVVLGDHASGEKQRDHPHYLKSSIYCRCGSRFVVTMSKSRQGRIYPYFMCVGRHQKRTDCHQKAIPINVAEQLVENLYRDIQLTTEQRQHIEQHLRTELATNQAKTDRRHRDLTTQKGRLLAERTRLLRAHYADAIPLDLLKTEQDRIARQLASIDEQLTATVTACAEIDHNLHTALQYAENCHHGYLAAEPPIRRLYNQAFFERIELSEHDATGTLNDPFDAIHAAAMTTGNDDGSTRKNGDDHPKRAIPVCHDTGLKETVLVPPAGFEPAAFCSGGRRSIP